MINGQFQVVSNSARKSATSSNRHLHDSLLTKFNGYDISFDLVYPHVIKLAGDLDFIVLALASEPSAADTYANSCDRALLLRSRRAVEDTLGKC